MLNFVPHFEAMPAMWVGVISAKSPFYQMYDLRECYKWESTSFNISTSMGIWFLGLSMNVDGFSLISQCCHAFFGLWWLMRIIGFIFLSELKSIMRTAMLCRSYNYRQCGDGILQRQERHSDYQCSIHNTLFLYSWELPHSSLSGIMQITFFSYSSLFFFFFLQIFCPHSCTSVLCLA